MTRLLTLVTALTLTIAAPALAQETVTLTMRSGERMTGDLVDMNASGLIMRINGAQRNVSPADVTVIEFMNRPGGVASIEPPSGQWEFVVLRNGQTVQGRLSDIGGTRPLRVTIDTPNGQRDLSSQEVAQVYLAEPTAVRQAARPQPQTPSAPDLSGGRATFNVPGNQAWTPTGITVQQGQILGFQATSEVRLSSRADDRVPPAGGARQRVAGPLASAPRGALIGRIDNGQPFLIGNQSMVRMPAAGQLFLGINDDVVDDNGGEFQVTIGVNPRRR